MPGSVPLAFEVKHLGIKTPRDMPPNLQVQLYGGGALIFDEFGQLKFNVRNRLLNPLRQTSRLKHLWRSEGPQAFASEDVSQKRFAEMHRLRYGTFPIGTDTEGAWNDDYVEEDHEEDHEEGHEEGSDREGKQEGDPESDPEGEQGREQPVAGTD